MRILCLTKYTARGPSSRYRLHQFLPFLEERGWSVDVQALHDDAYLDSRFGGESVPVSYLASRFLRRLGRLTSVKHYSIVFVQKEMFPYVPAVFEKLLARMGVRLVLDVDDAIHLFYERATGWRRRLLLNKIPDVMRNSSLVLAGNGYLASYASRYARRVVLFPTVVDTDRFSPRDTSGRLVVGWMGTPQTVGYLEALAPALASVSERTPFRLLVVGAEAPGVPGVDVVSRPWSEEAEVADLAEMDIGLMPLPDDDWSDGKCGLKLLQYMSMGKASIATPRGSVPEIVSDGVDGLVATTTDEWARALSRLIASADLRQKIGARARERVIEGFSLSAHGPRLADHMSDVSTGPRAQ